MSIALTIFRGGTGDGNGLGVPGAANLGQALARKLATEPTVIGRPESVSGHGWRNELAETLPDLKNLSKRFDEILAAGCFPVSALPRCAAAIATIPAIVRHYPDTRIVWFDAHADLNTPSSSASGYLGGMALAAAAGLWDSGLGGGLPLENIILAGVRDIDAPEKTLVMNTGIAALSPAEVDTEALRDTINGKPVYIHIDCDVLDPGIVPTAYECPGGLSLEQLNRACRILAEGRIIGVETAEFQSVAKNGDRPISPEPFLEALAPILSSPQGKT